MWCYKAHPTVKIWSSLAEHGLLQLEAEVYLLVKSFKEISIWFGLRPKSTKSLGKKNFPCCRPQFRLNIMRKIIMTSIKMSHSNSLVGAEGV